MLSVLGVLADERAKTLWLCSAAMPVPGAPPAVGKASSLMTFDLSSASRKGRTRCPRRPPPATTSRSTPMGRRTPPTRPTAASSSLQERREGAGALRAGRQAEGDRRHRVWRRRHAVREHRLARRARADRSKGRQEFRGAHRAHALRAGERVPTASGPSRAIASCSLKVAAGASTKSRSTATKRRSKCCARA